MRNVLQILRRDLKRLVTVPAAWVIMIGITIIPPLYAWFNIYGFWNPYGNTQGIKVAVANVDKGTDNALLGKMNLGDQIEDTLKDNDQLGWEFMGMADAGILCQRKIEPNLPENHRPRRDHRRPYRQQHLRLHRQRSAH